MSVRRRAGTAVLAAALAAALLGACATHLREAKTAYTRGQEFARAMRTEEAVASYKRAAAEAGIEARRNPSAQAYMVKGMAEAALELWREAETSFSRAFALGFESGRAWASETATLGLAVSFEELGFKDSAVGIYERLLAKSAFMPVTTAAAQRYLDLVLERALAEDAKERQKSLAGLANVIAKLELADFACGLYHYYHAQVEGHRGEWRRGYEEAVMARELGLPSERILRDNDNQIVFCADRLTASLPEGERPAFAASHESWTRKWGWKDARTPNWKQE